MDLLDRMALAFVVVMLAACVVGGAVAGLALDTGARCSTDSECAALPDCRADPTCDGGPIPAR